MQMIKFLVVPSVGSPVGSPRAEEDWLPRLGPTSMALLRYGCRRHGQAVPVDDVAGALGVKARKLYDTIGSLTRFGLMLPVPGSIDHAMPSRLPIGTRSQAVPISVWSLPALDVVDLVALEEDLERLHTAANT